MPNPPRTYPRTSKPCFLPGLSTRAQDAFRGGRASSPAPRKGAPRTANSLRASRAEARPRPKRRAGLPRPRTRVALRSTPGGFGLGSIPIRVLLALALPALSLFPVGCRNPSEAESVLAANALLTSWVEALADPAPVQAPFIPQGSSLHAYEPRPRDLTRLGRARTVWAATLEEKAFLQPFLDSAGIADSAVRVLDPSPDGRQWRLAQLLPDAAEPLLERLAGWLADEPELDATAVEARLQAMRERIARLRTESDAVYDSIPPGQRLLAITHSGLESFAEARNFRLLRIDIHHTEPGPQAFARAADQLRQSGARALLVEASHIEAVDRSLARETGLPLVPVRLDGLGAVEGEAATWESLLAFNAAAIRNASLGHVPAASSGSLSEAPHEHTEQHPGHSH